MIFLVLFGIIIPEGTALLCYQCQESTSLGTCVDIQTPVACDSEDVSHCMTLTYRTPYDDKRVIKKCMKKSFCEHYCQQPGFKGVLEKCQVHCCKDDLCNKNTYQVGLEFEDKVKRSSTGENLRNSGRMLKANIVATNIITNVICILLRSMI